MLNKPLPLLAIALCVTLSPLRAQSPEASPSPVSKEEKEACYWNQKILIGALEMYKLDKNTVVEVVDPAFQATLVSEGYLKQVLDDPGQGPDTANHYSLRKDGAFDCTVHGCLVTVAGGPPQAP